jgi:hypothetical protein
LRGTSGKTVIGSQGMPEDHSPIFDLIRTEKLKIHSA